MATSWSSASTCKAAGQSLFRRQSAPAAPVRSELYVGGPGVAGPISAILLLLAGRTEAANPLLTGDDVRSLVAF